eukprot:g4740.t1
MNSDSAEHSAEQPDDSSAATISKRRQRKGGNVKSGKLLKKKKAAEVEHGPSHEAAQSPSTTTKDEAAAQEGRSDETEHTTMTQKKAAQAAFLVGEGVSPAGAQVVADMMYLSDEMERETRQITLKKMKTQNKTVNFIGEQQVEVDEHEQQADSSTDLERRTTQRLRTLLDQIPAADRETLRKLAATNYPGENNAQLEQIRDWIAAQSGEAGGDTDYPRGHDGRTTKQPTLSKLDKQALKELGVFEEALGSGLLSAADAVELEDQAPIATVFAVAGGDDWPDGYEQSTSR